MIEHNKVLRKPRHSKTEELHKTWIRSISDLKGRLHTFCNEYSESEYEDFIRILTNFLAKELACENAVTLPGICTFKIKTNVDRWASFSGEKKFYKGGKTLKITRSKQLQDLLKMLQQEKIPLESVVNPVNKFDLRRNVVIIDPVGLTKE